MRKYQPINELPNSIRLSMTFLMTLKVFGAWQKVEAQSWRLVARTSLGVVLLLTIVISCSNLLGSKI